MSSSKKPNILLIMTDQQRWDALGCVGGWVRTPNLDRIASEGVRFDSCVTTSPVCVPARLNFATGHYCHNTGVWQNAPHTMAPDTPTWMQAIQRAGYRNCLIGKTHWHPHQGDVRDREHLLRAYGFDDINEAVGPRASVRCASNMSDQWQRMGVYEAHQADFKERFANDPKVVRPSALPLEAYYDTYIGEQTCEYLRGDDRDAPWFCWVSFPGPHEPWDTPEPYASRYDPSDMPTPRAAPQGLDPRPQREIERSDKSHPTLSPERIAQMRADYAGNITLIDDQIGQMLDTLEQRGEMDHTVIAFTSDHGEMNGDAGMYYKANFLDGAVRVPMIVRTPTTANGAQAGKVNDSPVEWSDLGPTLAELAGGKIEHTQFGRSLVPALEDPTRSHRDDALSELSGEYMLITDQWKLGVGRDGQARMLFDRVNDPEETRNRLDDPACADTADQLRLRLLERIASSQLGV